jgi:predicted phosphodiesterase
MRYGILADIHGNLHALQAVLSALERARVDAYLCAGDLVGYGPYPNECVEVIAGIGAVCVAGNHDLIALGRLDDARCIRLARESLSWTRGVLRDDTKRFLEALPERAQTADGVVLAHGSLDDPREYVRKPEQARGQLDRLEGEHPGAHALVLGHTHQPMWFTRTVGEARDPKAISLREEPVLLNPGSVGQSRERRAVARFLVLDTERGEAAFHAVAYEADRCREALRREGLTPQSCHLYRPSLLRWVGRVRSLAGLAGRRPEVKRSGP